MIKRSDIEQLFTVVKRHWRAPAGCHWVLSTMNPGDGRRYQLQLTCDDGGWVKRCYPRHGHSKTRNFYLYMEGMIDAIWDSEEYTHPVEDAQKGN